MTVFNSNYSRVRIHWPLEGRALWNLVQSLVWIYERHEKRATNNRTTAKKKQSAWQTVLSAQASLFLNLVRMFEWVAVGLGAR